MIRNSQDSEINETTPNSSFFGNGVINFQISLKSLKSLQEIIFNLTKDNLDLTVQQTMKLFDINFPYSFNLAISNLLFALYYSKKADFDICLNYLQATQAKETEISQNIPKIIDVFCSYISRMKNQEPYFFIEKMIQHNVVDKSITKNIQTKFFAHYRTKRSNKVKEINDPIDHSFKENYEELSKNDWELHKKLIEEGVNPSEIAKVIRNDDNEKLQEMASQQNFNINQIIDPSLYERYSYVNKWNVSLIDYAAFLDQQLNALDT